MAYAMSWCPSCKKWVPEDHMQRWIADPEDPPLPRPIQVGDVVRMCDNCLEGREVFPVEGLQTEEHREDVQCPFCESWKTEPWSTEEHHIPDFWRCSECGETFVIGVDLDD